MTDVIDPVEVMARGMLPVLCPGYEDCPGDVFDPSLDVFTYQRTLCLAAARAALTAAEAAGMVMVRKADLPAKWEANGAIHYRSYEDYCDD